MSIQGTSPIVTGTPRTIPEEGPPAQQITPSVDSRLPSRQSNLPTNNETVEKLLENSFKFFLAPLSILSTVSSLTTLYKGEDSGSLETLANWSNKAAYFFNGIYGAINNSFKNNVIGAIGYATVSAASIFGNEETMYLFKGPGSALDQMPAMLDDLMHNPKIKEIYNQGKDFNKHPNILDNIEKTFTGMKITFGDIYNDLISKKSEGIISALWNTFVKDERKAEKNLLVSTLGILSGCAVGIPFEKFRTLGSVIRDVFGFHADLALVSKFNSVSEDSKQKQSNNLYGTSGVFYTIGSLVDLVYRLFKVPKLNIAAVGLDNAGFIFMNWANWWSLRNSKEENKSEKLVTQTA